MEGRWFLVASHKCQELLRPKITLDTRPSRPRSTDQKYNNILSLGMGEDLKKGMKGKYLFLTCIGKAIGNNTRIP